jgi:membrane peptidoglycan carboxypeptidase
MLDMANGYATIANAGVEHPWYVVEKVTRASDNKTLYTAPHKKTKALNPDIAADVSYALQQTVEGGTGTPAKAINRPAAGKTGTATNDKGQVSSAWFIGYTPQLVTAVMYVRGDGNDQLDGWLPPPYGYFGAGFPAHTWAAIMSTEMQGLPVVKFPPPVYVDGNAPTSGHAPTPTIKPTPRPSRTPKPSNTPQPSPTPTPTPTPSPSPSLPPSPSGSPSGSPSLPVGNKSSGP